MDSKSKILVLGVTGLIAVAGFTLSTNYSNRDDVVDDYKTTTDGSFFKKHLVVQEDSADKSLMGNIDSVGGSDNSSLSASNLAESPGVMQGLWSKADGTNVTAEEFEQQCQQVYSTYWDGYKQFIGVGMRDGWTNPISVQYDPYKGKFGDDIGLIHYHQNPSIGAWGSFNQNVVKGGNSTLSGSGCGPTGLSAIFSTMLHKYITPLEIVAARDTMYLRLGQSAGYMHSMWSSGNKGAMVQGSAKVCEFVKNQKYNGKELFSCTVESLIQSRVDDTLAAGGMVLLVAHSGHRTGYFWTGGGHYIAIRAKDEQGNYYTVDGSHDSANRPEGNHDVPHPWADLNDCGWDAGGVHYITPGPGYQDYINSMAKGSSSGQGSSGASVSTQKILSMNKTEFFSHISDGKYSSYAEASSAYSADPTGQKAFWEGMVTEVEVPAWQWADSSKTTKKDGTIKIKVNKNLVGFWTDFMTDLHSLPEKYVMESVGGFSVRQKNNGNANAGLSSHSFGSTLDINAYCSRGMGSVAAPDGHSNSINYPVQSQSSLSEPDKSMSCTLDSDWFQLVQKYKLNWGGTWSDRYKDPMHFSLVEGTGNEFGEASYEKKGSKWQ